MGEARIALRQARKEVVELQGQLSGQEEQTKAVTEMMHYYSLQNDQLRAKARDENMVMHEAMVDIDMACRYVSRLTRQLMANPTKEGAQQVASHVEKLQLFVGNELIRLRTPFCSWASHEGVKS